MLATRSLTEQIASDYRSKGPAVVQDVTEALRRGRKGEPGGIKAEELSVRELAEGLVTDRSGTPCGAEWVRSLDPRQAGGNSAVLESGSGVDSTAFLNITGQIVFSKILEAYQAEAFVLSRMIGNTPTRLNGEKIPGVQQVSDVATTVGEGMPYPNVGFGEDWIETPVTVKRGLIVPVTKEAVFFDRTNLVLTRAGDVGTRLGINKEKRLIDVVIDGDTAYRLKWQGTTYATYQASTPWINLKTSNELVDWTDIDAVEQLFANMTDPHTGEPIMIGGKTVLLMPAKRMSAVLRVFGAKEVRVGDTDSASGTQTLGANPVTGYGLESSSQLYAQVQLRGDGSQSTVSAADAAKYWYTGDFSRAFTYMENWPITVVQAPQNSDADFNNDIVARFKASERGTPATLDPRFVVKSTG